MDYMIVMSCVSNKADVILTADHKTFYQLAYKSDAFCAMTYKKLYDKPFKSVLKYHHQDAMNEYLIKDD